jgi:hypothetical protein
MKFIKNYALFLSMALVVSLTSCRDEALNPVPEWESAVTGFAIDSTGSLDSSNPAQPYIFKFAWRSIDNKNTITKVDWYINYGELYTDTLGDPRFAEHGSPYGIPKAGKFWKTTQASELASNHKRKDVFVTMADIYGLYRNSTWKYAKNTINVFQNPAKPARTTARPFLPGDTFSVTWVLFTADGRSFDSWSDNVCGDMATVANCRIDFGVE